MKNTYRSLLVSILIVALLAFILPGCYETRYNNRYHHHSRDWYGRHHSVPPAGVNFDLDVR